VSARHTFQEVQVRAALLVLVALPLAAHSGGSNYGVTPGARDIVGKISEWPVPTPKFARDPAIGGDGNIYIAVMHGNKIERFDPKARAFTEWDLPEGAHPHGLVVAADGHVFYTGNGNGTIGELDPKTGKVIEHKAPSGGDPHTIVMAADGTLWFTVQGGGRIGHLDRQSGKITEYKTSGSPYGIALDKQGNVWFCRISADSLGRLDPKTGQITTLSTGSGSRPRRMAAAPDGTLWVTYYGNGKLAHVDPVAQKVVAEYNLPAGVNGGPYAVTVDARGRVWANEIETDTVAMFDPPSGKFVVFKLPSKGVGIRKAIIDGEGRYWYMGSHNGRLGVIE
jgi:virginiamycin B lyase